VDELDSRSFWLLSPEAIKADERRIRESFTGIDELDQKLMLLHDSLSHAIFDVWFLPWLIRERALSIWLEASLANRSSRIESVLREKSGSIKSIVDAVSGKDERARNYALKRYGVDIFVDREPFDIVLRTDVFDSSETFVRVVQGLVGLALFGQVLELTPEESRQGATALLRCPEHLLLGLFGS
jgi:cytidylate kinase